MCDDCAPPPGSISRRSFGIAAGAGFLASAVTADPAAATPSQVGRPEILPRALWAQGRSPKGPIEAEQPRFLLVHHTAEPGNDYTSEEVPGLIQGIFNYHTGSAKGWPDVAYNFFIDADGRIWEGREGSLDGPVRGSATGGNQGWSQLCCFLGNFEQQLPTEAARLSMVGLLAWLGERYSIDTSPAAKVEFESLGSNRWPAGTTVPTATIAGHRDMSQTTCPGDAAYAWVTGNLPEAVSALRLAQSPATTSTVRAPTTAPASTSPIGPEAPSSSMPDASSTPATEAQSVSGPGPRMEEAARTAESSSGIFAPTTVALGAAAVAVAGGATAATLRRRRRGRPHGWSGTAGTTEGTHWRLTVREGSEGDHVGTDGTLAWVLHGGWDPQRVQDSLADMTPPGEPSELREAVADLVAGLGPSPDSEGTIAVFLAGSDRNQPPDPDAPSWVVALGRGQLLVNGPGGSELLAQPVDTGFAPESTLVVRAAGGDFEVLVQRLATKKSTS